MAKSKQTQPPGLGIIAGDGSMPISVARAAEAAGRPVHVVALYDTARKEIEAFPHTWVSLGEVGRMLKILKKNECKQLAIVGSVHRPDVSTLRLDMGVFTNLPVILNLTRGGDNSILTAIVSFFEKKGFEVVGAHEVARDLLVESGPIGRHHPSKKDRKDIAIGLKVVTRLGELDVGQAAVVASEYVLAVEAAEGTDRMLARCKELRQWEWGMDRKNKRTGVFVKCAKPGQERRIDLPAIGPNTVRGAIDAGLSGLALAVDDVMLADREELVKLADEAGLFIVGVDPAAQAEE
jgi:DUF1009 family protein